VIRQESAEHPPNAGNGDRHQRHRQFPLTLYETQNNETDHRDDAGDPRGDLPRRRRRYLVLRQQSVENFAEDHAEQPHSEEGDRGQERVLAYFEFQHVLHVLGQLDQDHVPAPVAASVRHQDRQEGGGGEGGFPRHRRMLLQEPVRRDESVARVYLPILNRRFGYRGCW
jgi:hypothetical protein